MGVMGPPGPPGPLGIPGRSGIPGLKGTIQNFLADTCKENETLFYFNTEYFYLIALK